MGAGMVKGYVSERIRKRQQLIDNNEPAWCYKHGDHLKWRTIYTSSGLRKDKCKLCLKERAEKHRDRLKVNRHWNNGMSGRVIFFNKKLQDMGVNFQISLRDVDDLRGKQKYKCYFTDFKLKDSCCIELKDLKGVYSIENVVLTCGSPWVLCARDLTTAKNGGVRSHFLKNVRSGAAGRKIPYSLKLQDIDNLLERQENKCALSGLSFMKHRFSVDRIDSNKGYTTDNIQLVTQATNIAKHVMSNDEFIRFCRIVAANWRGYERKPIPSYVINF